MNENLEYAGFWVRVGAALIDTILISLIIWPVMAAVYGTDYWTADKLIQGPLDFLVSWVLPAVAVILFWLARQATPGKMAFAARIVDAKTGATPSTAQFVIRYLGYYVAMLPLFIGILWVAFDPRKQGWHDKLAGTVVVRRRRGAAAPVRFG
ncbi:MAG TPA: RDD family protein [Burkholderiaceae bacterium]|nr:RDD family protein [Burkholderiaceae bacterium]